MASTPPPNKAAKPVPQRRALERGMMENSPVRRCPVDHKVSTTLKRCKNCEAVWYCDPTCQLTHWKQVHKLQCAQIKEQHHVLTNQLQPMHTLYQRRLHCHIANLANNPSYGTYRRALWQIGNAMWRKTGRCVIVIPLHQAFPHDEEDWKTEYVDWGRVLAHVSALPKIASRDFRGEGAILADHPEAVIQAVNQYNPLSEIVVEVLYQGFASAFTKTKIAALTNCIRLRKPATATSPSHR